MEFHHVSILLQPCLDALNIKPDGVYVDATTGGAGHSLHIAQELGEGGRLICIDRDDEALENAKTRLASVWDRVTTVKSDFRDIDRVLEGQGLSGADGILFEYGEERYAPLIAAAIERERGKKPIETTLELVDIIRGAMPAKALREKQHPAKRSFQAIRIAVNDELGAVREAMEKAIDCLNPGGRLAVITFHSLEDRIVKAAFNQAAQGCTCPKDFPVCVCGKKPKVRLTPRKPILPSDEEIGENPRARSAKLRVCERI